MENIKTKVITQGKSVVILHKQDDFVRKLKNCVPDTITIIEKQKMRMLLQEARTRSISCVIFHVDREIPDKPVFERFRERFPRIPCIAVFSSQNMELARYCGTAGVDCVLYEKELRRIGDEITRVCLEKNSRVTLQEIGIVKTAQGISSMAREGLVFMEKYHQLILNTGEVADQLDVTECTLSREFAKTGLPGPKQILMHLKVRNSIKLMKNSGLNIREISSLAGFTDEKRMAECFRRMFGIPPGAYRERNINKSNHINLTS
jgi:transcriptional regulator GlxA family with amidase domain